MIFNMSNGYYFAVLIFTIGLVLIKSDKALLFDWKQNSLVEKEVSIFKIQSETVCRNCASACPAFSSEEKTYNYENSVGKKVLLVKEIYDEDQTMDKIELPECNGDGSIRASTILNKNSRLIEIGYEIHDRYNIINDSKLKRKTTNEFLSLYPDNFEETPQPKQVLSDYFNSDQKKSPSLESSQSFVWIPVLSIDLNINTMSPTRIEYNSNSGIHRPRGDCNQFDAGKEFYEKNTHLSAYSDENQRLIFTGKKDLKTPLDKGGLLCGQKYGCLVQHQVIPSYYMHSYLGALATCTYMNTVPIWFDIVDRIKMIDKYLYAMSQIWKSNIKITNGFYGIFKWFGNRFKRIISSGRDLYLDQTNNNIPVPLIFYKIVEYKITNAPPQGSIYYYYAVIVIHNDPTSSAEKQRICKDKELKGWEGIQNLDSKSGLTYVCAFNTDVTGKLNLFEERNVEYKSPLRLDDFPVFDTEQRKYVYHDKKSEIKDTVTYLFRD